MNKSIKENDGKYATTAGALQASRFQVNNLLHHNPFVYLSFDKTITGKFSKGFTFFYDSHAVILEENSLRTPHKTKSRT